MKRRDIDSSLSGNNSPGRDLLLSLAEYPHRSVQLSRRQLRSRIVILNHDQNGNVVSTTTRIEESEFTDLDGQWLD